VLASPRKAAKEENMSTFEIVELLTKLIPYLATVAIGAIGGWAIVKKKLAQIVNLAQKVLNFLVDLKAAIEDEAVSEAEFQKVWANGQEILKAFGEIIGYDFSYLFTAKAKKGK
jgi:hypothetical protein